MTVKYRLLRLLCAGMLAVQFAVNASAADAENLTDRQILEKFNGLMTDDSQEELVPFMSTLTLDQLAELADGLQKKAEEDPAAQSRTGSGSCGTKLKWKLDETGLLTLSGSGEMWDYSGTAVAPWYSRRQYIKKAVFELGVTHIGSCAFLGCDSLEEAILPASVEDMGWAAFLGCDSLKKVKFPQDIHTIGGLAFADCDSLTSMTVPAGVFQVELGTFFGCDKLESVSFHLDVTQIGRAALGRCTSLRKAYLMEGLKEVGTEAFSGCTALTSVTLPKSLTVIPDGMFSGCENLKSAVFTENLTAIGNEAFSGCTALKTVSIPNGVKTLGSRSFAGCKELKKVSFPESVEKLGEGAFEGTDIAAIQFRGSAPEIEAAVFGERKAEAEFKCNTKGWTEEVQKLIGENIVWTKKHVQHSDGNTCPGCDGSEEIAEETEAELQDQTEPTNEDTWVDPTAAPEATEPEETPEVSEQTEPAEQETEAAEAEETEAAETEPAEEETESPAEPDVTPDETGAPSEEETLPEADEESVSSEETEVPSEEETQAQADEETASAEETEAAEEQTEEGQEVLPEMPTEPTISMETRQAVPGGKVTLALSFVNNPGFVSASVEIHFDSTVLELLDVADTGLISGAEHRQSLKSPYRLTWANDMLTENILENGTAALLTFAVSQDAPEGLIPVSVVISPEGYDIFDAQLEVVNFDVCNGGIEIAASIPGDVNGDGVVNGMDRAALSRYLAGWDGYSGTEINLAAADLNGDGKVNFLDRAILARYLAGDRSSPLQKDPE